MNTMNGVEGATAAPSFRIEPFSLPEMPHTLRSEHACKFSVALS